MRTLRFSILLAALLLGPLAHARPGILVIVRHGESTWNRQGRFTGWTDVPLTREGRAQATRAAFALRGIRFDRAISSDLQRASTTGRLILRALGQGDLPVERIAAFRERHYGELQGLKKDAAAKRWGTAQVTRWRRNWGSRPPGGESLKDTSQRVLPAFASEVLPSLRAGQNVLLSIHGNSARAIVKALEGLDGRQVRRLELDNAAPLVYVLGEDGRLTRLR